MRFLWLLPVVAMTVRGPAGGGDEKIDPQLARLLEDRDRVTVILLGRTQLLETPGGFDAFCRRHADRKRSELRREVIADLRKIADREQPEIIKALGLDGEIRRLWIVNALWTSLTPAQLELAAKSELVKYVYPGEPIPGSSAPGQVAEVLRPVERKPFGTEDRIVPWNLQMIGAEKAWRDEGVTGEGTVVAVLDSGINYGHQDLRSNVWINPREVANNGTDDDGNGFVDDLYGFNFAQMRCEVGARGQRLEHGTLTSGIVGGDGSGGIVTGVAPRTRLMPLIGSAMMGPCAQAYQYALEQGADVISMSFSLSPNLGARRGFWRLMSEQAVCAGMVLAGGAGNFQKEGPPPTQIRTPKDVPCVIAAGGVDRQMKTAGYLSLGPVEWSSVPLYRDHPMPAGLVKPDVCAFPGPGYPVLACGRNDGYIDPNTSIQGNSFSGPHAAGTAALMLSANPELPAWRVKEIMEETAKDIGEAGRDSRTGAGLIDAAAAVRRARGKAPVEVAPPVSKP